MCVLGCKNINQQTYWLLEVELEMLPYDHRTNFTHNFYNLVTSNNELVQKLFLTLNKITEMVIAWVNVQNLFLKTKTFYSKRSHNKSIMIQLMLQDISQRKFCNDTFCIIASLLSCWHTTFRYTMNNFI